MDCRDCIHYSEWREFMGMCGMAAAYETFSKCRVLEDEAIVSEQLTQEEYDQVSKVFDGSSQSECPFFVMILLGDRKND